MTIIITSADWKRDFRDIWLPKSPAQSFCNGIQESRFWKFFPGVSHEGSWVYIIRQTYSRYIPNVYIADSETTILPDGGEVSNRHS